ncbi:MAG: hypothetical protein IPL21_12855 [Saprospirales bacterium]|nr:hypothetical protein [Saprospirales bacterium]
MLAILSGIAYFKFPDKIKALFDLSPNSSDSAIISTPTITTNTTDTALIDQLKADLIGKEVLSWNAIKSKEIKELAISSVSELDNSSNYIVIVQLDDNAGTKAISELKLSYNKIILTNVSTNKITYKIQHQPTLGLVLNQLLIAIFMSILITIQFN